MLLLVENDKVEMSVTFINCQMAHKCWLDLKSVESSGLDLKPWLEKICIQLMMLILQFSILKKCDNIIIHLIANIKFLSIFM